MAQETNAELDPEMLAAARAAGASDLFVMLAAVDVTTLHVRQNYVKDRVVRACDGLDPDEYAGAIEHLAERSGDYLSALWEGDLATALYHADKTNTRILVRLFDPEVLLSALAEERGSVESAEQWLDPVLNRYGWGTE